MTAIQVRMWALSCDVSGCLVRTDKDGHSVWLTRELALADVAARDRFIGFAERDGKHYCPEHSGFCEVCDTRRPMYMLIQDEEEGWFQCMDHLTERKTDEGVGLRAQIRRLQRMQSEG